MSNIIDFIKDEMSARAMTYDLLAEKAGMSKQNLWMKLNKNTRPNFDTVVRILKALDMEIIIEKDEKNTDPAEDITDNFFRCAVEEQVGYECVLKLLKATGNTLKIKTQINELNVKNGIDTF